MGYILQNEMKPYNICTRESNMVYEMLTKGPKVKVSNVSSRDTIQV